ncbi:MAG: autotransporter outer membrane beta-barrel domain-containing protein [Xanthobacteraceae bacterium]|nr:autotransporter outer membrane beta-barrel domain-containing protein [Xanthobacteraceae bacterium]
MNGNVYASSQAGLFDIGSHFQNRLGAIVSARTAASAGNNPQGGGAEMIYDRYRTWLEGYGINTTSDARDAFLGDKRKMYGGLAGIGMTVAPGVTLGVSVDRNTTDVDMSGASGRIDLTQIGAFGRFRSNLTSHGGTVGTEFRW